MAAFSYQRFFIGEDDRENSICAVTSSGDYWLKMITSPFRYGFRYNQYTGGSEKFPSGFKSEFDNVFGFDHIHIETIVRRLCYMLFCVFWPFMVINAMVCQ